MNVALHHCNSTGYCWSALQRRQGRVAFLCLVVASLLGSSSVGARDAGGLAALIEQKEGLLGYVYTSDSLLNTYREDLLQVLAGNATTSLELVDVSIPHMLVRLVVDDTFAGGHRAAIQTALDLARNYGLFIEFQSSANSPEEVVLVVSSAFPTLRFHWDAHPYEDVPSREGLWREPFADLGDVSEVTTDAPVPTLVFRKEAVARIDQHARIHGHRRFHLVSAGLEQTVTIGPFTWMEGLGRIAIAPETSGWPLDLGLGRLHRAFADRVMARAAAAELLELGPEVIWTAAPKHPRYHESLVLRVMQQPDWEEAPAYAPWFGGGDSHWVALRHGNHREYAVALPSGFRVVTTDDAPEPGLALEGAWEDSHPLASFLNRFRGLELALLLDGEVVGTGQADALRSGDGTLHVLAPALSAEVASRMEGLPQHAEGPVQRAESLPTKGPDEIESLERQLDFFQVRMMAEPQDRELIPVTHFAAPGSPRGVQVAVQNEIILDSRAVTGARIEEDKGNLVLHLSLTDKGRNALADVCFTNLGKQLAIVYEDQLLCAPTIVDWEQEELSFKGMNDDWPKVAAAMADRLGNS